MRKDNEMLRAELNPKRSYKWGLVLLVVMLFIMAGCSNDELYESLELYANKQKLQQKIEYDACLDTGGVPIRSKHGDRLSNCIYKN